MLLALGKIIYHNKASLSVDYFKNIGFACPSLSNPADYFMGMMSIESEEIEDVEDKMARQKSQTLIFNDYVVKIRDFAENYERSELKNDYLVQSPEAT